MKNKKHKIHLLCFQYEIQNKALHLIHNERKLREISEIHYDNKMSFINVKEGQLIAINQEYDD